MFFPGSVPGNGLHSQSNRAGQQLRAHPVEVEAITAKSAIPLENPSAAGKEGVVVHIWDGQAAAVAPQPHV